MKNKFDRTMHSIVKGTDALASIFLAATFLIVLLNVIMRYVFKSGMAWSEEASRYLFATMVFMGFIHITRERENYSVQLLPKRLKGLARRICYVVQDLVIIGLLFLLAHGAAQNIVLRFNNRTPALNLPEWILYAVILFSAAMMLFFMVINTVEDILGRSKLVREDAEQPHNDQKEGEKSC